MILIKFMILIYDINFFFHDHGQEELSLRRLLFLRLAYYCYKRSGVKDANSVALTIT